MLPKILTVDDSRTIRMIIKKMLSEFSCEVIEAENGLKGLELAEKNNPDMIILDIDMPGMNGLEVLMNLRNNDRFMNTPVFMLTSKSKEKNVRLAMELGIKAYISKPFKRTELIERIGKIIPLAQA